MSVEAVREYLQQFGLEDRVREFSRSSATVELAAQAVGVIPARIAKTLSFQAEGRAVIIVTAGDTKIDNKKYKERFGKKAKMLSPQEVIEYTGHAAGGVCPFANPEGKADVYLDVSLKRFDTVYPAAGSGSSCVELSCDELEKASRPAAWVDVCRIPIGDCPQ